MTDVHGPSGIALSLGGGAALGWSHIGFLRVLEEERVPIAAIAGTSIGALVALSFAAGKLDVLEDIARSATRRRVLGYLDPWFGRGAMLGGRRVLREIDEQFAGLRLEALPLPIALVAADLATAEEVRLTSGPAVPAVNASIAIPGLFRPVMIEERRLIDGGMVANVPLGAARALAPGRPLVGVDLLGDYQGHVGKMGAAPSALGIAGAGVLMMLIQQGRQDVALYRPDVMARLPIGHFGIGAFTRFDELSAIGRAEARAALPAIRAALTS